jgi:DNA-binding NarL/FixJ family response regulator
MLDQTHAYDPLVLAYRVGPEILPPLLESDFPEQTLRRLLTESGDQLIARRFALEIDRPPPLSLRAALTPREEDVLRLVARGLTNRQIAAELFLSPATIKVHVRHILEKLGVRTRAEAAIQAHTSET